MSIIFEALKRIEREKREDDPTGCSSIVFALPEEETRREAPVSRWKGSVRAALVAIPCVCLLLLFINPRWFGYSTAPPSPPAIAAPQLPPAIAAPQLPAPPIIKEVHLEAKSILPLAPELPTKPQEPAPAAEPQKANIPELHLKGISHTGNKSWAFINDKMVKLGDEIEGAEIVEILNDHVKLKYSGVEFTLSY
ncbi:MAG: hypothetical protein NTZ78_13780 [Candidatus Aureabacteria bacterium]|nr:hypothetical protein [Candidatus Auribacterota bacterium]